MNFIGQKETFEFDLNGYIIFRNFFSSDKIAEINSIIDSSAVAKKSPKFGFINLSPIFLDILSDERILETCHEWIDPHFRFDHAFGVQHFAGDRFGYGIENIHGGQYAEQKFFQYHWHNNRPACTCLIFSIVLEPQHAGEGGLIVVPGSHKSNLGLTGYQVFEKILKHNLSNVSWVVQPRLEAGDLLIFTEALMHGTSPWKRPDRGRRILYYKYCLSGMGWLPQDNEDIVELRPKVRNKQEELLLRPSYISLNDATTTSELKVRTPTYLKMNKIDKVKKIKNKLIRGERRLLRKIRERNVK